MTKVCRAKRNLNPKSELTVSLSTQKADSARCRHKRTGDLDAPLSFGAIDGLGIGPSPGGVFELALRFGVSVRKPSRPSPCSIEGSQLGLTSTDELSSSSLAGLHDPEPKRSRPRRGSVGIASIINASGIIWVR